jgi:hypothetical protein
VGQMVGKAGNIQITWYILILYMLKEGYDFISSINVKNHQSNVAEMNGWCNFDYFN